MKKILSFVLCAVIICLSAVPCFALWNGKHYKLPLTEGFAQTETGDGYAIWKNNETGSKIEIYMEENPKRLFYLEAEEEMKKEFTKSFLDERQSDAYSKADESGFKLEYAEPTYGEVKFEFVSGFSIKSETTRTSLDGAKKEVFDSDFYFFSTKDIVVNFRCELLTDKDKANFEKTLNEFELDEPVLTASNVNDSVPSPLILLVPLTVILLVVIIVVVVKRKNKTKKTAEEKAAE